MPTATRAPPHRRRGGPCLVSGRHEDRVRPGLGWGATLAIFNLSTRRVHRLRQGSLVAAPAWSPDGRWIAFENWDDVPSQSAYVPGPSEIYVVGVDGTRLRRLTRNSEPDSAPTWTQDGRIMFASVRGGPSRLYVMNRDGTRLQPVR